MPPHNPLVLSRWLSPLLLATAMVLLAAPSGLRAQGLASACNATHSPEEALRRLNETRARGAVCRRSGGEIATAAPVQWSQSLAEAATAHAREQAALNRMGHRDSQNRGLGERLRLLGYRFSSAAENVAVGYPAVDDVLEAWLESEGHCENLMNAKVVEVGLACHDGPDAGVTGGGRYWTLVLGLPQRAVSR